MTTLNEMRESLEDINEKCSCGGRLKHKCVKESDSGSGKMCVKSTNKFAELCAEREEKYPEEMAEAQIWAKDFLSRWKEDPSLVEIREIKITDIK